MLAYPLLAGGPASPEQQRRQPHLSEYESGISIASPGLSRLTCTCARNAQSVGYLTGFGVHNIPRNSHFQVLLLLRDIAFRYGIELRIARLLPTISSLYKVHIFI